MMRGETMSNRCRLGMLDQHGLDVGLERRFHVGRFRHLAPVVLEHLHVELSLRNVPHEIIVVDDGSSDRTWEVLSELAVRVSELRAIQNNFESGFGRAVIRGLDEMRGDAVVIMMADESDDCRDVVRYWEKLNEGYDCVFGSRFMKGGGIID